MNKLQENLDLLEKQISDFTNKGFLLRNIFSIYINHPLLSLLFILSFGMLTNALFELFYYLVISTDLKIQVVIWLVVFVAVFSSIPVVIYFRIRALHKDLFTPTSLSKKRVLITIVSNNRSNFRYIPSYSVYNSLIYTDQGHAIVNSLEKVVLIVSDSQQVKRIASSFKAYIQKSERTADMFKIVISDKSIIEIKKQLESLFTKLKTDYKPYEIISDYTGGTKNISIALLKVSEDELVTPIYLNDATLSNHSKY